MSPVVGAASIEVNLVSREFALKEQVLNHVARYCFCSLM